jgi:sensor histidine kinase YesM
MLGMDPASALTLDGLKGIGILNIYARMKMLYRESTVFTLYNKSGSGACVELGGIIMQSGESVV